MKEYFYILSVCILIVSCTKDEDDDENINTIPDQSFIESFDTASSAVNRGWTFLNESINRGTTDWSNPPTPPFGAFKSESGQAGYLWADYNSTSSAAGIISNWAVSPIITLQNRDTIIFYTRAELYYFENDSTDFVNRLQVRINKKNTGTNTGEGVETGDFNVLLLDINPEYRSFYYIPYVNRDPDARLAYPHRWTRFEAVVSGLTDPVEGRFAFRYFVEDAGNNGRGTSIGIDEVTYKSAKN